MNAFMIAWYNNNNTAVAQKKRRCVSAQPSPILSNLWSDH